MSQKKKTYEFNKQTPVQPKAVRKIETDEILKGGDKFEYLLAMYWKPIVIGIAALAVVIVILVIGQFIRRANDATVRSEFAAATTIEALEKLIKENPAHPASINARFQLAALYSEKKSWHEAHETLRQIANQTKAAPFLRVQAALQAAYMTESAGKDADALNEFSALVDDSLAAEPQHQEAVYSAARLCVKLNKKAQAERLLASINYEKQDSVWVAKAAVLKMTMNQPAPVAKPAVKAEAKPAVKAEAKPAVKAEAKPAVKAEAKPAVQPTPKAPAAK